MFSKIIATSTLLAGLAAAQAQYNTVVNNTPQDIQYGYTGPYDAQLSSGVIPAYTSMNFDLGESRNVKMCFDCSDPGGASSGILQFEADYESSTNSINYDWSDINGPEPFSGYTRTLQPSDSSCPVITCPIGDDSNDCEYTTPDDFNPPNCNAGGPAAVTAIIGDAPSKLRRHARTFRA